MFHAIEAVDLLKTYPGGVCALDGLSFAVAEGTIFGLLGPNGAGKSTAMRILTTLGSADGGTARISGHDVRRESDRVRRCIGVVAQRSGLDDQSTASENLRLQGRVFGLREPKLGQRADTLIERFGISEAAARPVHTLSGGMQRRLDIALALVHEPRVLLLDEPTTGLDPDVRASLWDEVSRLNAEGMTVLLTTHYLQEADSLASRVAIMNAGRTVIEGTPEDLKRSLKDDFIHLELRNPEMISRAHEALAQIVTQVQNEGGTLQIRVADGVQGLPSILAALNVADVPVDAVSVSRPSLDDVYVRYTGRNLIADDIAV